MGESLPAVKQELDEALREGDGERAERLTQQALTLGADPLALIQEVVVPTMTVVGQRFQDFEIYLPELIMAGDAAKRATAIIEDATRKAGKAPVSLGTVVLGSVEGDVHDIGKNIVGALLSAHGFRVIDIGRDVKPSRFLAAAEESGCEIVAVSALMTTTLPAAQRTLSVFTETGQRANRHVIVGGGAVTDQWAQTVGFDGYSGDAAAAVVLCKALLGRKEVR